MGEVAAPAQGVFGADVLTLLVDRIGRVWSLWNQFCWITSSVQGVANASYELRHYFGWPLTQVCAGKKKRKKKKKK